ncbi:MAG: metal-dependent transcriptional regulator [Candidatus Omnitrophica bacterium]|nr:metal-dependent transcriptional regulator [Candidatus Omnitrophota bacterium]
MSVHTEHIEELLELCWTAAEDNPVPLDRDHLPAQLLCFLPHPIEPSGDRQQETLDAMIQQGLLLAEGRAIRLSPTGQLKAQAVVRRHRLAEVLLSSVLEVSEESMESTACQVEHILNAEVTGAVCAFLGHPPSCPHGRSIPKGPCCEEAVATVGPLLVPLTRLAIGEEAVVAFVHTRRHAYLQRLSAFGVAPGRAIRLRQTQPALVVQLGETELALDPQAGQEIFVRRHLHGALSTSRIPHGLVQPSKRSTGR